MYISACLTRMNELYFVDFSFFAVLYKTNHVVYIDKNNFFIKLKNQKERCNL